MPRQAPARRPHQGESERCAGRPQPSYACRPRAAGQRVLAEVHCHVVDYRTQRYEDFVSGYDVVLDTLGKAETIRSMKVLRPGGTLVTVVGAPEKSFAKQLGKPLLSPLFQRISRKERKAAKQAGVEYSFLFMRANGAQLAEWTPAIEAGEIKPLIGETFAFDQLPEALAQMAAGKSKPGKTVVTVSE